MDESESHWKEHPKYPVSDWKYEVENDDTRQSYREWCDSCAEQDDDSAVISDEKVGSVSDEQRRRMVEWGKTLSYGGGETLPGRFEADIGDPQDSCRTCGAPYAQFDDGYDGECPTCADRTAAKEAAERSIRITVHEAFGNAAHGVASHVSADFRFLSTDRAEVLRQVAQVAVYHWTLRVWGLRDGCEIETPPMPTTDEEIVETYFSDAPGLLTNPPLTWRRYELDLGAPFGAEVDLSSRTDKRFKVVRLAGGGSVAEGELAVTGGGVPAAIVQAVLESFVLRLTEVGFPVHLPKFRELLRDCCEEAANLITG